MTLTIRDLLNYWAPKGTFFSPIFQTDSSILKLMAAQTKHMTLDVLVVFFKGGKSEGKGSNGGI